VLSALGLHGPTRHGGPPRGDPCTRLARCSPLGFTPRTWHEGVPSTQGSQDDPAPAPSSPVGRRCQPEGRRAELPCCYIKCTTIQRLENVGIVVDDLAAATTFFVELGLKVLGEGPVEGGWVDRVVGLEGVRVDIAMLETSDGRGRLELMKFHAPPARGGDRNAPPNTLGIRRVAFAVDDIDAAVAGLQARGAELLGGVERYEDSYRLCYVRGPEGIIVMLAEQIG
jgi:catechol 2,3-dioxygenase-like lactoylglutathione lyase family enzyme